MSYLILQLISQSPLLANNPQLQDQMRTMMPQFVQQMQNPEVQSMLSNPQALNAIMQIQQGMEQLRSAAPGLVGSMGNIFLFSIVQGTLELNHFF